MIRIWDVRFSNIHCSIYKKKLFFIQLVYLSPAHPRSCLNSSLVQISYIYCIVTFPSLEISLVLGSKTDWNIYQIWKNRFPFGDKFFIRAHGQDQMMLILDEMFANLKMWRHNWIHTSLNREIQFFPLRNLVYNKLGELGPRNCTVVNSKFNDDKMRQR